MAKAPVVTELPTQSIRFLFGTPFDLKRLPSQLRNTGKAEIGEFMLVGKFPEKQGKTPADQAAYIARHEQMGSGLFNIYHGNPYKLDRIDWVAGSNAGVHMLTKDKYGQILEFPTVPSRKKPGRLHVLVSEYVQSNKDPTVTIRASGFGGHLKPTDDPSIVNVVGYPDPTLTVPKSMYPEVDKKYHKKPKTVAPVGPGGQVMTTPATDEEEAEDFFGAEGEITNWALAAEEGDRIMAACSGSYRKDAETFEAPMDLALQGKGSALKSCTGKRKDGSDCVFYIPKSSNKTNCGHCDLEIPKGLGPGLHQFGAESFGASQKQKSRKGPTISATKRKVGTRMRGNDGKMWQVKKAGKSQRWMAGAETFNSHEYGDTQLGGDWVSLDPLEGVDSVVVQAPLGHGVTQYYAEDHACPCGCPAGSCNCGPSCKCGCQAAESFAACGNCGTHHAEDGCFDAEDIPAEVLTDALIQWEDDGYSSASIPPDDIFWADSRTGDAASYIFDHDNELEDRQWRLEKDRRDVGLWRKEYLERKGLSFKQMLKDKNMIAGDNKLDEIESKIQDIQKEREGLGHVNLSAEDTLEVPSTRFNVEMNAEGGYTVTHNAPDRDGTIEIWEGPAWAWDDIMENLFLDLEMGWMHTPDDLEEAMESVTMKSRDHSRYMAAETFEAASGAHPELDRDLASLERQVARKYRRYSKGGNVTNAYKLTGRGGSAVVYGPLSSRFGAAGTSSNKFYTVWVYQNKEGSYTALSGWAGLGRPNPQLGELGTYKDRSRAVQAADKKMQSKRKKGYFAYDAEGLDSAGKGFGYTFGGVMGIAGGLTALGVLGWLLRPVLGGGSSE
jgi:hypothetical protein